MRCKQRPMGSCCCSHRRRCRAWRLTTLPSVRILVPLAAGGAWIPSRAAFRNGWAVPGQSFVVDNRPARAAKIALDILSQAAPDGYTLMMISAKTVVHPILYKSRSNRRDFAPPSQVGAGYVLW